MIKGIKSGNVNTPNVNSHGTDLAPVISPISPSTEIIAPKECLACGFSDCDCYSRLYESDNEDDLEILTSSDDYGSAEHDGHQKPNPNETKPSVIIFDDTSDD